MAEKIRLKGQLKLPVVGKNPTFAQMKFVKVALSEPDILPDSGSIFTCDELGNYDFEIYTGKHLLSYNVGNSWSKPAEIIAEHLADGLESIEISDLIGFQEIPELDATIAALNQQKQELLIIQQNVDDDRIATENAKTAVVNELTNIDNTLNNYIKNARSEYCYFSHFVNLPAAVTIPALGLTDAEIDSYTYDAAGTKLSPVNSSGENCWAYIPEFGYDIQTKIPDGMQANVVLLVEVFGSISSAATKIHAMRVNMSYGTVHPFDPARPFLITQNGSPGLAIVAREWSGSYQRKAVIPIDNDGWIVSSDESVGLRILNLGANGMRVNGVGIVVLGEA